MKYPWVLNIDIRNVQWITSSFTFYGTHFANLHMAMFGPFQKKATTISSQVSLKNIFRQESDIPLCEYQDTVTFSIKGYLDEWFRNTLLVLVIVWYLT